jgi:hypothetical protein
VGRKGTNGEEKEVKKLLEKCGDIIRKFYYALNLPELKRDSDGNRRNRNQIRILRGFSKYVA